MIGNVIQVKLTASWNFVEEKTWLNTLLGQKQWLEIFSFTGIWIQKRLRNIALRNFLQLMMSKSGSNLIRPVWTLGLPSL